MVSGQATIRQLTSVRIVQLADYAGVYPGSFIPMLRSLTYAARQRGHEVELAFTPAARGREWLAELEADRIPVRFAPSKQRSEVRIWLEKAIDERPTVLHTHFTAFDIPAVEAAQGASATKVFWHIHSRARPELAVQLRNIAKNLFYGRRVTRILCVAPDIQAAMRRRLADRRRTVFFPNAIDTERFVPAKPEVRAAARRELGLTEHGPVLLHLGWDWDRKGGDLFLRAAQLLADDYPSLIAVTVGGGAEAADLAADLGIEMHVRSIEPTDRVQRLYAAADLFVSSSRAEGMPFAMAEALTCGVPVVASDIPGHVAIGASLDACRITALDPRALALGAAELLSRPNAEAFEQAKAARQHIRSNMDLDAWSKRMLDLYELAVPSA